MNRRRHFNAPCLDLRRNLTAAASAMFDNDVNPFDDKAVLVRKNLDYTPASARSPTVGSVVP